MIYTNDQIRQIVKPIAEKHGLPAVYIFGSYARGTATEESDIDLLVDTTGTALRSLFALGGLYNDLDEAFDKPVDMVTLSAIEQNTTRPSQLLFRENIMRERRKIYAVS